MADDTVNTGLDGATEDLDALAELDALFAEDDSGVAESEVNVLSQNLSEFAHCFPDWDLHPPVIPAEHVDHVDKSDPSDAENPVDAAEPVAFDDLGK